MVKKDNILRGWMSDIHCTCQQKGLLFSLSKKKKKKRVYYWLQLTENFQNCAS